MNLRYDDEKKKWICDQVTVMDYIDIFMFLGKHLIALIKFSPWLILFYICLRIVWIIVWYY